jgi:hypothetical protein
VGEGVAFHVQQFFALQMMVGLLKQFLDGRGSGARDGLIGRNDQTLDSDLALDGGQRTTIWMVEQFGLAMMSGCSLALKQSAARSGLTSGTTSGTSFSMRKALVLSIITAPAAAAAGAYFFEIEAPAEESTISTPLNDFSVSTSTGQRLPRKTIERPRCVPRPAF